MNVQVFHGLSGWFPWVLGKFMRADFQKDFIAFQGISEKVSMGFQAVQRLYGVPVGFRGV